MQNRVTRRSSPVAAALRFLAGAILCAAVVGCGTGSAATVASGTTTIKVGIIADETLPGGLTEPDPVAGAQARVDAINAAGGIHGRRVALITCNGSADPNASAACAREMVSDGVVAVIGAPLQAGETAFAILTQAAIPVIAGTDGTDSANTFTFDAGSPGVQIAAPQLLAALGATRVAAIFPQTSASGTATVRAVFDLGVKKAGITSTGLVSFPIGSAVFGPVVAKALSNHVTGIYAFAPTQTLAPLISAIRQQAPQIPIVTLTVQLFPSVIKALGAQASGLYAVGLAEPATAEARGIEMFNQDMDKYEPSAPRTDFAINAWAGVWVFERVVGNQSRISRTGVLAAMKHLHGLSMGGIYPTIDTTKPFTVLPGMRSVANPTVVYDKIENGRIIAINHGRFVDPFPSDGPPR